MKFPEYFAKRVSPEEKLEFIETSTAETNGKISIEEVVIKKNKKITLLFIFN